MSGNLSLGLRSLMKAIAQLALCLILIGCGHPPPKSKAAHIKQVQNAIVQAGGEAEILKESQALFPRCSKKHWARPGVGPRDHLFNELPGIQSLGDVFYYEAGQIRIRIYNSHWDVYFIYLIDPGLPQPTNFERIAGNVGFMTD